MNDNNLPVKYKSALPAKIKKGAIKAGKIAGSTLALVGSVLATPILTSVYPPLFIPAVAAIIYTGRKFENNTFFTTFKDLAFMAIKGRNSVKIYQDAIRPDMLSELIGMNKLPDAVQQKMGFLQLQALVGMTKFDQLGRKKDGTPLTIKTQSHKPIRKTFQKLQRLGYIEGYEETFHKKTHLIVEKLAFGNGNFGNKVDIYNISCRRTDKPIDFEDPALRRMFPAVFGKKGVIATQGYTIETGENGELVINYHQKERRNARREQRRQERMNRQNANEPALTPEQERDGNVSASQERDEFLQQIDAGISLEQQRENVHEILNGNDEMVGTHTRNNVDHERDA